MSIETASIAAERSCPSSSKKQSRVSVSLPAWPHTNRPVACEDTKVTYEWPLRHDTSSTPMTNRLSSRWGSSPSTMTRSMIRPVVSQSIRTRRRRAVLSMVVASHPTRSSKSRVKREPARANGTPWVSTPWVGQARRASSARICRRHRPRSRCRQLEATVRRSYLALVVNPHRGGQQAAAQPDGDHHLVPAETYFGHGHPTEVDEALECCCGTHGFGPLGFGLCRNFRT